MTIKYLSVSDQDSVANSNAVIRDTLKTKPASTITGESRVQATIVTAKTDSIPPKTEYLYADTNSVFQQNAIPANSFPILFTKRTNQIYAERKTSNEKHLRDGETIPQNLFHNDWVTGIILIAVILFSIVAGTTKNILRGMTRFFLFRGTGEDGARDFHGIFQWQSTIINLSSFLIVGLFGCYAALYYKLSPPEVAGYIVWLIALGTIIIALTMRHFICVITGSLSGEREVFRDYLHTVYQSYRYGALILFLLVILMSYTSFLNERIYFITGFILIASIYLIRIIRLFIVFINRNISIFYLILYLCALEILPVLIFIKYFSGME
jgi:hypothetical protein